MTYIYKSHISCQILIIHDTDIILHYLASKNYGPGI